MPLIARSVRAAFTCAALTLSVAGCVSHGDAGDTCRRGDRCEICSADGCSCVYGDYCELDDDCFVGCDDPAGCPVYRCSHYRDRDFGVCTSPDWPPPSSGTCEEPSSCASGQVEARLDGVDYCLNRCTTNADCGTCCGRLGDGALVCAPTSSYCGSDGCPSGSAPMYPGGPCVEQPPSCPDGWAVCNCPDYHGAWCHPDCEAYRRGEGGPGTYCGGTSC